MADTSIIGLFDEVTQANTAVNQLRELGITENQITLITAMPYPREFFGLRPLRRRLGLISLLGALLGVGLAAFLTVGIFLLYPLEQGGQPIVPIPPSLIVLFEVTMLGTMYATFFGMLALNRFPRFKAEPYDASIADERIGVQVDVADDLADRAAEVFNNNQAQNIQRVPAAPQVDRGQRIFWASALGALAVIGAISLLFFYDVIRIPFPTNMYDQDSIAYDQGPRLAAPAESVPIQGPALIGDQPASVPIASSPSSIQRGSVLFGINCVMCHGKTGQGNGPVGAFFTPKPRDLTSPEIQALPDNEIYLVLTNGFGAMPSIAENLTPEERWDVTNFVRTLKK